MNHWSDHPGPQVQSAVTNESRAFQLLKQAERAMAAAAQSINQVRLAVPPAPLMRT